ncbi:MBL fold metallo-hydrolase [Clostridium sp. JN-9]|uniref:MBL fold metallo-hydrolase n=1 Tax=Clostridium sp. JN-9 TaxID=2507159 RepID=UPI000FFE30B7|nr:MBL fold metallo-hydrolase [Clostridium sp. JN-9]QAT39505.1 MBL fold metallo-hydrolase [Clostridium sp. JN-9]
MILKRIPAGVYAANCYIIMDEASKESAVIDPGGDEDHIINEIRKLGAKVDIILLTHGHADHTGAVDKLKKKYNVPAALNSKDKEMMMNHEFMYGSINYEIEKDIKDGDRFTVGSLEINCVETPGHTPGGVSFIVGNTAFTGDTLFQGSIGRTDFKGGDHDAIIRSIKTKLLTLPENTIVYPGHGPETTIKYELVNNPYL